MILQVREELERIKNSLDVQPRYADNENSNQFNRGFKMGIEMSLKVIEERLKEV